jgi:GNAT superfamily N-acetyltransferase
VGGSAEASIRPYAPERDEEALRALVNRSFGLSRGPEYFRWKYLENPAGPAEISVAEVDGTLASMACVLPLRMRVGGAAALGSLSVDVATLPEFRGQGLYRRAARHLWERLARRGFALTAGFTNRLSTRLTLEVLGRRQVGPLPVRVRPLRPLQLALSRLGLAGDVPGAVARPPSGGDLVQVEKFDERFDALWQRIEPGLDIATVRDAAFLNWRYAAHPERPYETLACLSGSEVRGYLVWRLLDRFGTRIAFTADLAAEPGDARTALRLLRCAADRARASGATLLALLSWPGSPVHAVSRRFALLPLPRALFPQENVFSVISHRPEASTESLAVPKRWWISWGDSDVV